jgi:hypothetical protein
MGKKWDGMIWSNSWSAGTRMDSGGGLSPAPSLYFFFFFKDSIYLIAFLQSFLPSFLG